MSGDAIGVEMACGGKLARIGFRYSPGNASALRSLLVAIVRGRLAPIAFKVRHPLRAARAVPARRLQVNSSIGHTSTGTLGKRAIDGAAICRVRV